MSSLRRPLATATGTAALAAVLLCSPSAASATPAGAAAAGVAEAAGTGSTGTAPAGTVSAIAAPTVLVLTVNHGVGAAVASRTALLICDPAGGDHPLAGPACAELTQVAGDVGALADGAGPCTMIYDPVTVTVDGWWQGSVVSFRATYANSCLLLRQTRAIFDF
ncbi:subtilase-type protease inhibitor [Planosporangium sp. 12N6]|uniref:subtilase-type protease inhibitor n=1 Tax=Planosporangium spinosum TaxID=3402278 RepID=UPI003CE6712A